MQLTNKKISFCASTSEIRKALTAAVSTNHSKNTICPSKAGHLNNLFTRLEGITEDTIIRLDEKITPESVKNPLLAKFITWLNEDSIFKCKGIDNCKCGQGMKNKEFLSDIFKQLGLKNPNILELGK